MEGADEAPAMLRLDSDASQRCPWLPSSPEAPCPFYSTLLHPAYPLLPLNSRTTSYLSATRSHLSLLRLSEGARPSSDHSPHTLTPSSPSRVSGSFSMDRVDTVDPFAVCLALRTPRSLWFLSLFTSRCMHVPDQYIGDCPSAPLRGPPKHAGGQKSRESRALQLTS